MATKPQTPAQQARAERRRATRAAAKAGEQTIDASTVFTMDWTGEQLAFLRLLLTNATIQPAALKKVCGTCQEKVEGLIGPLPPGQ